MGRPKLNRTVLRARVASDTPEKLKKLALELGFQYGADGNTGKLLDAIAQLEVSQLQQLQNNQKSDHSIKQETIK